jgi:hypothetical protein
MKAYRGSKGSAGISEWSAHAPAALPPVQDTGTHGVGPRRLMDGVEKRNVFSLARKNNPGQLCTSSRLRHCATNWKVAGSIPDDVTGIFH